MDKAVALKYDQSLPAPFISASGKGELARRIVTIAKETGIHVVSSEAATEALVELEPGSYIPEELYGVIAELLVFVKRLNKET